MNKEIIDAMKAVIDGTTPTAGEWMSEDVVASIDNEIVYKKMIENLQKDNLELSIKVKTLNEVIDKFMNKISYD